MSPVHGERVLREIVGADREEIGFHGHGLRQQRGCRCLDHDTDLDGLVPADPGARLLHHGAHGADLRHVGDHRQENAALAEWLHSENGTQLLPQEVGPPQARPHAAQARAPDSPRRASAGTESACRRRCRGCGRSAACHPAPPRAADIRPCCSASLGGVSRSRNRNSVRSKPQPSAPLRAACCASASDPMLANTSMRMPSAV